MPAPDDAPSGLATRTSTELLEGLRTAADGSNGAAWTSWVERYRPLVMRYARRVGLGEDDAEDAAQAALLAFATGYREGRYDRERGRLRTWLYGIAVNKVRELRRRRRDVQPSDTVSEEALLGGLEAPASLEAAWEAEWRDAVLRQCLEEVRGEVEAHTFRAFVEVAREGRSPEEVAAELGMSRDAVYAAKRRVLRRVRDLRPSIEEIW